MTVNHDLWYLGALLLATGATTILLRAFPFICFGGGRREQPRFIRELGRLISPAAIAMLIVYCYSACFDGHTLAEKRYGAAEILAGLCVVLLQRKWANPLLSIAAGTAVYMLIVQRCGG